MATIVIKDLSENTELDRQAMLAIAGGARFRAGAAGTAGVSRAEVRRMRLFDLAPGSGARQARPRAPSR
jgi:hypothetical protein